MALSIPKPPVAHPSVLKATTRAMLAGHALRRRSRMPDEALKVTLTPYSPTLHGGSFLLHVWMVAVQNHEQAAVFGPAAETVESFVQVYRSVEMVVVHRSDAEEWWKGAGVLAVAFLDDCDHPARARIHHFVWPEYRTPGLTQGLATLTLQYCFEQRGFYALYGITPVANRAAVRFALRLGFHTYGLKPMVLHGQMVDGLETVLNREQWAARRMVEGG